MGAGPGMQRGAGKGRQGEKMNAKLNASGVDACGCGKRNCKHERWAWLCLAGAHPHEAAEMDWRRFLRFVRRTFGPISVRDVREVLAETYPTYHSRKD